MSEKVHLLWILGCSLAVPSQQSHPVLHVSVLHEDIQQLLVHTITSCWRTRSLKFVFLLAFFNASSLQYWLLPLVHVQTGVYKHTRNVLEIWCPHCTPGNFGGNDARICNQMGVLPIQKSPHKICFCIYFLTIISCTDKNIYKAQVYIYTKHVICLLHTIHPLTDLQNLRTEMANNKLYLDAQAYIVIIIQLMPTDVDILVFHVIFCSIQMFPIAVPWI